MEIVKGNLYDYPAYYDLVFGADWKTELKFMLRCFDRYAERTVRRIFEPACGTGRLLHRLARRGFEVSGLDLNPHAVAYCNARLKRLGLRGSARVGDMADFRLPHKVDAAMNLINSFRHLPDERSAEAHLECMARSLNRGGLFFLALHLSPLKPPKNDEERWSARRGRVCVNTRLWTRERDLRRRREACGMVLDIYTPTRSQRICDELIFRTYTRRQILRLLSRVPELELVETFDFTYNVDSPIELTDSTEDAAFVLRKR